MKTIKRIIKGWNKTSRKQQQLLLNTLKFLSQNGDKKETSKIKAKENVWVSSNDVWAAWIWSGNLFHNLGAATEKALTWGLMKEPPVRTDRVTLKVLAGTCCYNISRSVVYCNGSFVVFNVSSFDFDFKTFQRIFSPDYTGKKVLKKIIIIVFN